MNTKKVISKLSSKLFIDANIQWSINKDVLNNIKYVPSRYSTKL